ncbi:MAG TPA: helix-turn-helix domain-containing protein [Caulobacteraceae bacterium]|nr:helix-turn-helix domain-containing protein [Caulobacteraceae bacterium]
MSAEYYEGLEATVSNLRRLLGNDAFHRLTEAFGGRRLYIRARPGPNHPITVAIGQEAAEQLAGAFHGVDIDVPMSPQRRAEILRLDRAGKTRAETARILKITERWVYKVLEEGEKTSSSQPDLF